MDVVPYEKATSGANARDEIRKLLMRFGCTSVGFMDNFDRHELLLAFEWRGRKVQITASAAGWAALFLAANPWNTRRRATEAEWKQRALDQGLVAVNSVLRDLVKGQITAVECGMLTFEHVFLPHMLTSSGQTVADRFSADDLPLLTAEVDE